MTIFRLGTPDFIEEDRYDRFTGATKAITSDHSYIHEGKFFEVFKKATLLANTGTLDIGFLTPANGYVHYRPSSIVTTADNLTVAFYEGSTISAGTTMTARNHNRNSVVTATSILKDTPTVTGVGTQIAQAFLGGGIGVGQTRSGGERGEVNEWVLKPNTQYLIRFSNASSVANIINVNLTWYEESIGI